MISFSKDEWKLMKKRKQRLTPELREHLVDLREEYETANSDRLGERSGMRSGMRTQLLPCLPARACAMQLPTPCLAPHALTDAAPTDAAPTPPAPRHPLPSVRLRHDLPAE